MLPWLIATDPNLLSGVRDTSLAKLVRDDMLGMILKGVLVPGQRINEPDVASRLQVSRVPVREALRELESSGLVVSRKHSGVFVRQLDAAEILDLYQLRGLLDGFAGRCAAQLQGQSRQALLDTLEASAAAMIEAAARHDVQHYYAENLHFHWAIVEATGNRQLIDTYRGIVQKLHISRLKNLSQDIGMQASIAEHVEIMAAVRDANDARCEALMSRHVAGAFIRLRDAAAGADPASAAASVGVRNGATPGIDVLE
ncbi:MAG: transcriptional regulator, GntR family [Polaromonas sp.]|nr:transcriptional regulator, GntR family [Polaromonas sp.]